MSTKIAGFVTASKYDGGERIIFKNVREWLDRKNNDKQKVS